MKDSSIILVGMMGSGKTAVGRILAEKLERPFCDSDARIAEKTGAEIETIFEYEGEESFRNRESDALREILRDENKEGKKNKIVLAVGGGATLRESNRDLMKKSGAVVYLRGDADLLCGRLKGRIRGRPLLGDGKNLQRRLARLINQREKFYLAAADVVVDLSPTESPRAIADRILRELKLKNDDRKH